MTRIEHLVFIAGGVIVPRLTELALAILFPCGEPSAEIMMQATSLERKVVQGMLTPDAYCQRLSEVCGMARQATVLSEAICERLTPQACMLSLLAELALRLDLRLVCDYPRAWWEPVSARHGLDRFFANESIYYTDEVGDRADYAAFLQALVADGAIRPGRTLWVDYHSPRTSAAIRTGIDAAIFVDIPRLRRDLGLWKIVPPL